MHLANLLGQFLPDRLARLWCELQCKSKPLCQYTSREMDGIVRHFRRWEIRPAGTEGFNKAEVTLGGVDTRELSSKTMECRKVPGLHFTGEVLDVTGQLGGYNLHWAWASGHAAGQAV
jgi:predicted flavoprotein YhiN